MDGKTARLRRIFNRRSGKTFLVPLDHGVTLGLKGGPRNIPEIVKAVGKGGGDGVVVHKGAFRIIPDTDLALILHISASTILSRDPDYKTIVSSVEEALRLGADGVSIHINIGAEKEHTMISFLGEISEKANIWGMPLLAMVYPRGKGIKESDPDLVGHAARLGFELGADLVKVPYTGDRESFRDIVSSIPIPVLIAGGVKAESEEEFLSMVKDAMEAGAAGVSIGRNIFQSKNPEKMAKAVSLLVHENASLEKALEVLKK